MPFAIGNCIRCGQDISHIITQSDKVICTNCGSLTLSGLESHFRPTMETLQKPSHQPYPVIAAGRAMAYSDMIYSLANKGTKFDMESLEKQLMGKANARPAELEWMETIEGRTHEGQTDASVVCVVLTIFDGQNRFIYVVFRGSVGFKQNTGAGRAAGDQKVNVDWRANFDNDQCAPDWGGPGFMVHEGFHKILKSYRADVFTALEVMTKLSPQAQVIITGHSQGAAHAILFAHQLSFKNPQLEFFCLPRAAPRVGNFEFVENFNQRISDFSAFLRSDQQEFPRCLIGVQGNDPVWQGQKNSFFNPNLAKVHKIADKQGILPKKSFAGKHETDETKIYYHPKHLVKVSKFGMHIPGRLKKSILKM